MASRAHACPLRELDRRSELGLERLAPALLRRAVPGVVLPCLRRGSRRLTGTAAGRSVGEPAVEWELPQMRWDRPGARCRRHGHLGHVLDLAADLRHLA